METTFPENIFRHFYDVLISTIGWGDIGQLETLTLKKCLYCDEWLKTLNQEEEVGVTHPSFLTIHPLTVSCKGTFSPSSRGWGTFFTNSKDWAIYFLINKEQSWTRNNNYIQYYLSIIILINIFVLPKKGSKPVEL